MTYREEADYLCDTGHGFLQEKEYWKYFKTNTYLYFLPVIRFFRHLKDDKAI